MKHVITQHVLLPTEHRFYLPIPMMPSLKSDCSRSQQPLCQMDQIIDKDYNGISRGLREKRWMFLRSLCVYSWLTHGYNDLFLHQVTLPFLRCTQSPCISLECLSSLQVLKRELIFKLYNLILLQGQFYLFILYPASFQKKVSRRARKLNGTGQ